MRVDFYQLGGAPIEIVLASLAAKLLADDQRMLVIGEEETLLARLDRLLWDQGAASFLPHGLVGGADDARQPILLSTTPDTPNLARNLAIADGVWRDAALGFDRTFYLFDADKLEAARLAWKLLSGREGVDRHYWAQSEAGGWIEKA
jgi:DNA polymerase-3 subunit chi